MLMMKKKYFGAIRAGVKTTTLRFWLRPMVRPGEVHTVRGLGRLRIDAVRCVGLAELTEADARADGFDDLGALRRALGRHYTPEEQSNRTLYQVRFAYLDTSSGGPQT